MEGGYGIGGRFDDRLEILPEVRGNLLKGESMEFKTLDEILEFAISKEVEAEQFYVSLCEEESLSGNRQLFQEFAKEERKHVNLLESLKTGGVVEGIENYTFKWIKDIKRSDLVLDIAYQKGMHYRDILMLAIKREEKALKLYNDLLSHADTETSRKVFKILCQEEAKHKLALESMYDDYMAEMGD
jgi:rubrerythrin